MHNTANVFIFLIVFLLKKIRTYGSKAVFSFRATIDYFYVKQIALYKKKNFDNQRMPSTILNISNYRCAYFVVIKQ